jgi:hypothetical protein
MSYISLQDLPYDVLKIIGNISGVENLYQVNTKFRDLYSDIFFNKYMLMNNMIEIICDKDYHKLYKKSIYKIKK